MLMSSKMALGLFMLMTGGSIFYHILLREGLIAP